MGVPIGELLPRTKIDLEHIDTVAIDAYNAIYQFLSIIRQRDGTPLMDSTGRVTSHLSGLFYRTANMIEAGVRPVYVFDGEPPEMKKDTVIRRRETRENGCRLEQKEELTHLNTRKRRLELIVKCLRAHLPCYVTSESR
jgi:flap endonuclease-1